MLYLVLALVVVGCAGCVSANSSQPAATGANPPVAQAGGEDPQTGVRPEEPAPAGLGAAKQPTDPNAPPPDVASAPADAQRTPSGLAYRVLAPGTGTVHPTADSRVEVHYTGWTTDGNMFDSSVMRGRPATFPLESVIPGWSEGVQLMVEGEKARLWIPEALAYKGRPGTPQGTLVFDIELLKILPP